MTHKMSYSFLFMDTTKTIQLNFTQELEMTTVYSLLDNTRESSYIYPGGILNIPHGKDYSKEDWIKSKRLHRI